MAIRSILAFLALPLLASCVQQGDLDSLGARMARNEQQMQHLSSQVGNVEQVLPGQAEMWAQMQAMRQELNTVRGQLDEMTAGSAGGGQTQDARTTRLETAVRQMAAELGVKVEALDAPPDPAVAGAAGTGNAVADAGIAIPADGAAGGASTPPAAHEDQTDTAVHLYDSGMKAFASRNYRDAVKAFTDFTRAFPDNKLTSNAHFWRGESYYQLKDYAGAALAYQDVIQKFPGAGKFQSAMLKQGMALYSSGAKDAARARLDELVKKYPRSPEAGRAKKFMQDNK